MTRTLEELKLTRKEAIEVGSRWSLTADEVVIIMADDKNLRDANLGKADLWGANLREADLWEANLGKANLREADLWEANLGKADLRGADLWRANLWGANLRKADLWGANLLGANLGINRHIRQISPIGSDKSCLVIMWDKGNVTIRRGCFSGNLEDFKAAVAGKPDGDPHRLEYEAVIVYLETVFSQWKAAMEGQS